VATAFVIQSLTSIAISFWRLRGLSRPDRPSTEKCELRIHNQVQQAVCQQHRSGITAIGEHRSSARPVLAAADGNPRVILPYKL
jgi:hypothetical protein